MFFMAPIGKYFYQNGMSRTILKESVGILYENFKWKTANKQH